MVGSSMAGKYCKTLMVLTCKGQIHSRSPTSVIRNLQLVYRQRVITSTLCCRTHDKDIDCDEAGNSPCTRATQRPMQINQQTNNLDSSFVC